MEAIFSSKLYTLSKRKEKISSALQDPINKELVLQLEDYLQYPEEVEEELVPEPSRDRVPEGDFDEFTETKPSDDFDDKTSKPTQVHFKSTPEAENIVEEVEDESSSTEEPIKEENEGKEGKESKEESEEVAESVKVQGATALYQAPVEACCCPYHCSDAELVKGTLNAREDTQGVSRVTLQDRELWIYYQDKINLNNVMEPAIAVLNAANFNHLEFNRLARTQNAIVFEVTCIPVEVKPMKEINE